MAPDSTDLTEDSRLSAAATQEKVPYASDAIQYDEITPSVSRALSLKNIRFLLGRGAFLY